MPRTALPDSEQSERRSGDVTPLARNGTKAVQAAYHPTGGLSPHEKTSEEEKEKESPYPAYEAPFPQNANAFAKGKGAARWRFDRNGDGDRVAEGDADGVGVVLSVPAIFEDGMPAVDIDGVGNAIPSSGGHLSKTDRHAVADILADAIRSGINAKVRAIAAVVLRHRYVLGAARGE